MAIHERCMVHVQASLRYGPPSTGAVTLQNGGLQPKTSQGGISLNASEPNRLPGMLRQADYIQQKQDGYSPPVTPTSATEGTAFAGQQGRNATNCMFCCAAARWPGLEGAFRRLASWSLSKALP